MTTEGNLSKAARSLGKYSLKIPFGQIRILKTLRRSIGYSYHRNYRKKPTINFRLDTEKLSVRTFILPCPRIYRARVQCTSLPSLS